MGRDRWGVDCGGVDADVESMIDGDDEPSRARRLTGNGTLGEVENGSDGFAYLGIGRKGVGEGFTLKGS